MKASEYFEQYKHKLDPSLPDSEFRKNVGQLYLDFLKEMWAMAKIRHIKNEASVPALIDEFNQKWNKLAKMFRDLYDVDIIGHSGFKRCLLKELEDIKC